MRRDASVNPKCCKSQLIGPLAIRRRGAPRKAPVKARTASPWTFRSNEIGANHHTKDYRRAAATIAADLDISK